MTGTQLKVKHGLSLLLIKNQSRSKSKSNTCHLPNKWMGYKLFLGKTNKNTCGRSAGREIHSRGSMDDV